MRPDTAKQLEAILDTRQQQKQTAVKRATEQQSAEDKNPSDFAAKKEETIKPAFQEIVDLYKARGISIRIAEQDERANSRGGTDSPSITLDMSGDDHPSYRPAKPEFRFTFQKRDRNLSLYTSTGSQSGPAGSVSLDTVTAEWIQDAFLKYQAHF